MTRILIWTGAVDDTVGNPANWDDITGARMPALAAPGADDIAQFDQGHAALAASLGATLVARAVVITGGSLSIGAGAAINAHDSVTIGADATIDVQGGTIDPLTVSNAGKIGGSGTLDGNVTNTGTIYAQNGVWEVTGNVSSTGHLEIDAAGTLQLDGSVTGQTATFIDGTGKLVIEQLGGFAPVEIDGFQAGDTIDIAGQPNVTKSFNTATSTLALTQGAATVPSAQIKFGGGTYFQGSFVLSDDSAGGTKIGFFNAPCFAAGTRIQTLRGEVPVEELKVGRSVRLARGGSAKILWLGHRRVDCRRHPRPQDVMPVRVRAHAFGPDTPRRDVLLSPDHAVYIGNDTSPGVLIPIRYLINGATVVQENVARITYWHVELAAHDVLLAEGLAVESYLDTGNRDAFANGGKAVHLHPDFALRIWKKRACARLVRGGRTLRKARQTLLRQAAELGYERVEEASLHLLVDGTRLAPELVAGRLHRFRLPRPLREVRLVSRAAAPAELDPESPDRRRLGVMIEAIAAFRPWQWQEVKLSDIAEGCGFHPMETEGSSRIWRWTDGNALLTLPGDQNGVLLLDLEVAAQQPSWRVKRARRMKKAS